MDSRPFFIYFDTRKKPKCETEKPHITSSNPILDKEQTGQVFVASFPPGSSLKTGVLFPCCGAQASHASGESGQMTSHMEKKLKLATEDERDVDLIKPLPLSWLSRGLRWMLETTQRI